MKTTALPIVGLPPDRIELDLTPPLDWILIRLDPAMIMSKGGIHIADQARPVSRSGIVIRTGPGMVSEDGHTRLPIHCAEGDRVLFERAAGKSLPRCPTETQRPSGTLPGRWGYVIVRDGSICAVIEKAKVNAHEQRALDSGDAGLPLRPPGAAFNVSRAGAELDWTTLRPVQDWLVIRADAPPKQVDQVMRPDKRLRGLNGKPLTPLIHLPDQGYERGDLHSGTVLARGEGLLTVTRCLDGDRVGRAPKLCKVGDRVLFWAQAPWAAGINEIQPLDAAAEFLLREYPQGLGSTIVGLLPPQVGA